MVDYLTTEISTSKQKKFSLVTFVDTPGLVDGDMKYPFDVNESIQWLGNESRLRKSPFLIVVQVFIIIFNRGIGRYDFCLLRPDRTGVVQAHSESGGAAQHPAPGTPTLLSVESG